MVFVVPYRSPPARWAHEIAQPALRGNHGQSPAVSPQRVEWNQRARSLRVWALVLRMAAQELVKVDAKARGGNLRARQDRAGVARGVSQRRARESSAAARGEGGEVEGWLGGVACWGR